MIIVTCPHCGQTDNYTAAIAPDFTSPEVGDATACFGCGEPAVFAASECCGSLIVRVPTVEESCVIEAHPVMKAAREALAENRDSRIDAVVATWRKVRS
jgi:hypothetical protein